MEIDVEAVEELRVQIGQQVLRHGDILVSAIVAVTGGSFLFFRVVF